jgi:L-ascorbate 6-phosphate lactonase
VRRKRRREWRRDRQSTQLVIPLYYELFEPNVEQPGHFVDYLYDRFPAQPSKMMARGEPFLFLSP